MSTFALCNKCGVCCEVVDPFDGPIEEALRRSWAVLSSGSPLKPCRYLTPEKTCAIYDTRPKECYVESVRGDMSDEEIFAGCKMLHRIVRRKPMPDDKP